MVERIPISKEGYQRLREELTQLEKVERIEVIQAIATAREHGDLKENAEYHAAKEQQKQIDNRLQELADLISSAKIVDPTDLEHSKVSFGSTVVVCDVNTDEEFTYTIVGGCESNPDMGLISFNSPLAKQLLGREEGDDIKVQLPNGTKEFEIVEVRYQEIVFECN